jgi:hypothetical protein
MVRLGLTLYYLSASFLSFRQGSFQSVVEYKSVNGATQALGNRQLHLVRAADGRGIHRVLHKAPTSAGIDLYCVVGLDDTPALRCNARRFGQH